MYIFTQAWHWRVCGKICYLEVYQFGIRVIFSQKHREIVAVTGSFTLSVLPSPEAWAENPSMRDALHMPGKRGSIFGRLGFCRNWPRWKTSSLPLASPCASLYSTLYFPLASRLSTLWVLISYESFHVMKTLCKCVTFPSVHLFHSADSPREEEGHLSTVKCKDLPH